MRPRPASLTEALVGQTVRRVETGGRTGDRRAVTEIEFLSRDLVRVTPERVPPDVQAALGLVCRIAWRYISAFRRRDVQIGNGARRLYATGDGAEDQVVLSELLVGRTLAGVDGGAATEDGYPVERLTLLGGDVLLVSPLPIPQRVHGRAGATWALAWTHFPGPATAGQNGHHRTAVLPGVGFLD